jgi:anthranilate phosphoribosyltransferase
MRDLLEKLLDRRDLSEAEAAAVLGGLTQPGLPPAMGGAILAALRAKGVVADELRGLALAMRALARRPLLPAGTLDRAIDIVGTGGDASGSLNLSTGAALLVAACGVPVVKHGNRSISSRSGSAAVLEQLGLPLPLDEQAAGECLAASGFTFLFAPHYHPAMKAVAPLRQALGVRTVFNILGPLTNPASAPHILMGVFHPDLVGIQIRALQRLGAEHALVVYGRDGMDEVSLGAATLVGELNNGDITEYEIHPEDFGLTMASHRALRVDTPEQSRDMVLAVLDNQAGPARDIVALNAGIALYAANVAPTMAGGIALAQQALAQGLAKAKLAQLNEFTARHHAA